MKRRPASGTQVMVLKAPREAKYLQGKVGMLVYTHELPCVSFDGKFAHLRWSDLKVVRK